MIVGFSVGLILGWITGVALLALMLRGFAAQQRALDKRTHIDLIRDSVREGRLVRVEFNKPDAEGEDAFDMEDE